MVLAEQVVMLALQVTPATQVTQVVEVAAVAVAVAVAEPGAVLKVVLGQ